MSAKLGSVAEQNPVCRMAPWSVQNDRTKDQGSYVMGAPEGLRHENETNFSAQDLTSQHTKNCSRINRAVFLSAIPVVHFVAVFIFARMAYTVGESEYRNHLIGMAITTAVVGFIPLAMLAVFGIGTAAQYIICRPPVLDCSPVLNHPSVLDQLREFADAWAYEADKPIHAEFRRNMLNASVLLKKTADELSDEQARMPEAVALSEAIQAGFNANPEEHSVHAKRVVQQLYNFFNVLPSGSSARNAAEAAYNELDPIMH